MTASALSAALALCTGVDFFISPNGNNGNAGIDAGAPLRTFANALARLGPGDRLVLLDGVYSRDAGTGGLDDFAANPIPQGLGRAAPTVLIAARPGAVRVDSSLELGTLTNKARFLRFDGISFSGSVYLYNANDVEVLRCGVRGDISVGTNDHAQGNDDNLFEDDWVWGGSQQQVNNSYSKRNVYRRLVLRGDGCSPSCSASAGITIQDSTQIALENVIVVDRQPSPGDGVYGDFFSNAFGTGNGDLELLGCASVFAPAAAFDLEPGVFGPGITRVENCVAWQPATVGFTLQRQGKTDLGHTTIDSAGSLGIYVGTELEGYDGGLHDLLVFGTAATGVQSSWDSNHMNVFGAFPNGRYVDVACTSTCLSIDPRAGTPPSLRYPFRIEADSALADAGTAGSAIGANVVTRYGVSGTHWGDPGFDTLTAEPLWPWPNETRLSADMCAGVTRGFCAAPSLTVYLWGLLGNPVPPEIAGRDAGPGVDAGFDGGVDGGADAGLSLDADAGSASRVARVGCGCSSFGALPWLGLLLALQRRKKMARVKSR